MAEKSLFLRWTSGLGNKGEDLLEEQTVTDFLSLPNVYKDIY